MAAMAREVKVVARDVVDEEKCIICMGNVADSKFEPCGESGVCAACAFNVMETTKTCPMCWTDVRFFTRALAAVTVINVKEHNDAVIVID